MSEKTRGSNGILPNIPHFWFGASPLSSPEKVLLLPGPRKDAASERRSKICSVALSEVTARSDASGEMPIE